MPCPAPAGRPALRGRVDAPRRGHGAHPSRPLDKRVPPERIVCEMPVQDQQEEEQDDRSSRSSEGRPIDERRSKMERLRAEGIDPYPAVTPVGLAHAHRRRARRARRRCARARASTPSCAYQVAGRLISRRGHGKTAFLDLRDLSGSIQVVVRVDALGQATYDRILGARHRRHRRRRGLRVRHPARTARARGRRSARC